MRRHSAQGKDGDGVNSQVSVSLELLQSAFGLAEDRLRGEANRLITQKVTSEAKTVRYEGSLNAVLQSALSDTFSRCSVKREYNKIDICMIHQEGIVAAIESKGMVANSHSSDRNRISIDLHGIRTKLYPDRRSSNSVQADISEISGKIPIGMECPRFEIFVPVVYELYRDGGSRADWFREKKPWVTLPKFKELRENMVDDLAEWFRREDPQISLIHATKSVELRNANEFWLNQAQHRFPEFTSLEAYVSFYAFGRFVE